MPKTTAQLTQPSTMKEYQPLSRRPFATLSNSPNKCNKQIIRSTKHNSLLDSKPQSSDIDQTSDSLKKYVDLYREFYSNRRIHFDVAQLAHRTYRKKRFKKTEKRDLESIVLERKELASEQYFARYNTTSHGFVESGEFVVFEFFNVALPLIPGSFDMCFQAFICTVDESRKTLDCDELTDFWCPVNKRQKQGAVREVFLRRPSFKTTKSDIYLFVHCYGNVVKCRANSSLINCVKGFGIGRIGQWTTNSSYKSLLSAEIDYTARAVHLDQSRCEKMDIKELSNWKPDFKMLDKLRKKFLTKQAREMDEFLIMELSNENGLGDFDEMNESLQASLKATTILPRPSTSSKEPAINKYVFNLSSQPSSILSSIQQIKEDCADCASSSGYGSMPGSSTSSSTTEESIESNKSLNLSVDSNSCVICTTKFDTISDLLLHLETRYPSLKFSYDSVFVDQICVTIPAVVESVSPKNDYLLLNRSLIKQYRNRILTKVFGRKVSKPETPTPTVEIDQKSRPLELNGYPLSFNPPVYHKVTFPGFYGVDRTSSWLSIYQSRKLKEFVDVTPSEMTMIKLWNDFQSTIRTVLLPQQIYGASVVFVREKQDILLKPSIYPHFIVHLSNMKRSSHLSAAEFYDIVSRLRYGPKYDPRADTKHFVHIALKNLERQRAINIENQRQNGVVKKGPTLHNGPSTSSSRHFGPSNKQKSSGTSSRKRSAENASNPSGPSSKRARVQPPTPTKTSEIEVEKKRQFNTQTPMTTLLQNSTLKPEQMPIFCFDDLACRYQFVPDRQLKLIWHFCQPWTRKCLE